MRRAGFTLVEVVVTMVIVTGFLLVTTRLFFSTQKQAVGAEARFASAVLAQIVAERLRSEVTLNPTVLKALMPGGQRFQVSGRVTPGAEPALPFFEPLGMKDFDDYRVDVTIENDEPTAAAGANAALLREMVKRVTITVARASVPDDPAAFTLRTRLLTPVENFSMPALDQLYENFESARLDAAYEEFYEQVADNPYFSSTYLTTSGRDLIADCYIVMGAINTEAYLSDGQTVSPNLVLTTSAPAKSMTTWVRELTKPGYYEKAVFKKQLARVNTARLTILFDAFKKVSPVLTHLLDEQDGMLPKVESIKGALLTAESTILSLDQATLALIGSYQAAATQLASLQSQPVTTDTTTVAAIDATKLTMDGVLDQILGNVNSYTSIVGQQGDDLANAMEFINMVKFLDDFFSKETFRTVFDRLKLYPSRFSQTVLDIEKPLRDFVDQARGPRPLERVVAAQRLVEAVKLKQLDQGHADPAALAHINHLADGYETSLKPLATYLRNNEVHDYTELAARNTRFLAALQDMRKLSRQYERIVASYDAGGAVKELLAVYGRIQKEIALSSDGVMAQITRNVRSLAAATAEGTVTELSRGQIQSAITGVTAPPPATPSP